eukprot:TRINITY_DN4550_c0_g1_i4.p1 TRINITY_DN4550_c0_g1~~TRINITY_DN4550_c0_g1_i4.p1  ORF type:complete len:353 (+),score=77.49 TRINITY_DN4550_c0_g1_i4:126-1184(+)
MAYLFRGSLRQASAFSRALWQRSLKTLILAEHQGGSLNSSSKNAIAAAQLFGRESEVSLLMAGCGPSLHAAARQASSCHPSVSQVLIADSEIFHHALAESWAELIRFVQQKDTYSHIIVASNSFGKNVLPRAAALLDVSPITDITQINSEHTFVRPIYAGNALCTIRYFGPGPCMISIRPTSFRFSCSSKESNTDCSKILTLDVSNLDKDIISKSTWLKQTSQEAERPDLSTSQIVVTGGRGLKNAENFKLLEKLADKLGAAVGATRAAVDAGFVPNELQVGQTGKIVAPELYFAFGVSGAIQHIAGMKDSKVIVAVNKDADAPIFQVADYGLVEDIFQVIPELLEKLPEKK